MTNTKIGLNYDDNESWLLTIDYWLLTIDYSLLTIDYWLLTIDYRLLTIDYWLLIIDIFTGKITQQPNAVLYAVVACEI